MEKQKLKNIVREQLLEYYILHESVSLHVMKRFFKKQFWRLGKPALSLEISSDDEKTVFTARLLNLDSFKLIRYKNPSYGKLFKNGKLIRTIPGHEVNIHFPELVADTY